jgi:3-deoxy-D-arabino-heptulosonate 7-phosphate (DAHP) synthase
VRGGICKPRTSPYSFRRMGMERLKMLYSICRENGIGVRRFVPPMALAFVAARADGVLIEMHATPEKAAIDGHKILNYSEFRTLVSKLRLIHSVI